ETDRGRPAVLPRERLPPAAGEKDPGGEGASAPGRDADVRRDRCADGDRRKHLAGVAQGRVSARRPLRPQALALRVPPATGTQADRRSGGLPVSRLASIRDLTREV